MNTYNQNTDYTTRSNLRIEEACVYFRIGENKMWQIIHEHRDADFVLHTKERTLVKRAEFERYIDTVNQL